MNNIKKNDLLKNLKGNNGQEINIEDLEDMDEKALGLRVILENYQGKFVGVINNFHKKRRLLFLEQITILLSKNNRTVNYRGFFYDSIDKIYIVGKDEGARGRLMEDSRLRPSNLPILPQHIVPSRLNGSKGIEDDDTFSIVSELDLESFEPVAFKEGLVPDFIFIDKLGEEFNEALTIIRSSNKIGLSAVGQKLGRLGSISCLVIHSTILHIFDVAKIKASIIFDSNLREIMENSNIMKVMHDGRALQDYLHHRHQIIMENVFDIQACDLYICSTQNGGSLPTLVSDLPFVINNYLNLPTDSIWALTEDISESLWFQRPLVSTALAKCTQHTIFLKMLRDVMLKVILTELEGLMEKFVNSTVHLEDSIVKKGDSLVVPYDVRNEYGIAFRKLQEDRFNKVLTYTRP